MLTRFVSHGWSLMLFCKQKSRGMVHNVEHNETNLDDTTGDFPSLNIDLDSVEGVKNASAWFADLSTDCDTLNVQLDTSAEVSALPLQLFNESQVKPPLKPRLIAYGGTAITPTGTCKFTCRARTGGMSNFMWSLYKLILYWN